MSEGEWGPVKPHDGVSPPPYGMYMRAFFEDGDEWEGIPSRHGIHPSWYWRPGYVRITSYRIRKPRGLTILEGLLADLPAPGSKDVPVLVPDGVA